MNNIDYEQAFSISQQWAQQLAFTAVGYAVEERLDDEQCNKRQRLTSKQWERLCTFFVIPNAQMDRKLNFNFEGSLTRAHQDSVIKFIQASAHKKVLEVLMVDHDMSFEDREYMLQKALENMPIEPLWEPKKTVFPKNYTCVFDEEHLRCVITRFIDQHLSLDPLCSAKMSSQVYQPNKVVKPSSRTISTGPR